MSAAQLGIHRLSLTIEAPSARGDRIARHAATALRGGLAAKLAQRLPATTADGPVVLIRRVAIDLEHAAEAPFETLVDRVAEAIALAISKAQLGASSLTFRDRATFTAAFLEALLDGGVWSRWWFRSFRGLQALPISAAILTVLLRDKTSALRVLSACAPALRVQLWRRLDDGDAHIVLDALATEEGATPDDGVWLALSTALLDDPSRSNVIAALAAVVDALADREVASARVIFVARRAAAIRMLLHDANEIARALADHEARGDGRRASELAALPAPFLTAARRAAAEDSSEANVDRWHGSALLGFAILLPFVDELAEVEDWPAPSAELSACNLLRLLVLSACAGPARRLWREPVWRNFFGLPGLFDEEAMAAWSRSVGAARWRSFAPDSDASLISSPPRALTPGVAARRALRGLACASFKAFAARLPGFADAPPTFLRARLLEAGGVARIEQDALHVRLARPPLDVMLGMSSLGDRDVLLADGRRLILERTA